MGARPDPLWEPIHNRDMKYGYSSDQMRAAEAPHLAAGEPLMAHAAHALAGVVAGLLGGQQGPVLVLVGPGNNGGDALYAAAELANGGVDVTVAQTAGRIHAAGLSAALQAGAQQVRLDEGETFAEDAQLALQRLVATADVIVDGILGTGTSANAALRGRPRNVIAVAQKAIAALPAGAAKPIVVAVDIPSGIDPNTGAVPSTTHLDTDITVTFGGYKAGLLTGPAADVAGDVRLIDIGLTPELSAMKPTVAVD